MVGLLHPICKEPANVSKRDPARHLYWAVHPRQLFWPLLPYYVRLEKSKIRPCHLFGEYHVGARGRSSIQ